MHIHRENVPILELLTKILPNSFLYLPSRQDENTLPEPRTIYVSLPTPISPEAGPLYQFIKRVVTTL
jgi:hypothetical protein